MTSTILKIEEQLNLIESELKQIGFWNKKLKTLPDPHTFEHWLQFVFIPNAREAVKTRNFPKESNVGLAAMRQYDYHSFVPEAQNLLKLLYEFDKLINSLT
ncbi:YqcC family protein [Paracrocinitomix mangrovi]|uniref:YqcC family protein n=1 Tax=Paracrocinitomix mangrovi TaxID=2862509 RepID=UPI001C8DAEB5|nr:YqcC family protein [Paracrocinitomix mangrovi]UKN02199.1 YqcC family protein [Paracrocinitomix mangrovi]